MKKITTNAHNLASSIDNNSPWFDIKYDPPPEITTTDLQQCIKDCLRLATMAEWGPANKIRELDRLQRLIEAQVQKELDAWKALMGQDGGKPAQDSKEPWPWPNGMGQPACVRSP